MPKVSLSSKDTISTAVYGNEIPSTKSFYCPFCTKTFRRGSNGYWHRKWQKMVCVVCRHQHPDGKDGEPIDSTADAAARKLLGMK